MCFTRGIPFSYSMLFLSQNRRNLVLPNIGHNCIDCHDDVHEGFISEKYYPQKTCNQCHSPEGWADVTFDHLQTSFVLQGAHQTAACISCHVPDTVSTSTIQIGFISLNAECTACHENIHDTQFEVDGKTDCLRCHDFKAWKPGIFDHNTARFVLEGRTRT